jgi:DNA-binding beta-propeller fold protein YncE
MPMGIRTIAQKLLFVVFAAALFICGCDELKEQREDLPPIMLGGNWDYPYYLVIGGGLSETLSLLTINGPGEFDLANDVQKTASGIHQTFVHDSQLYALCSLSNSLVIYDEDLSIDTELSLGVGTNPIGLALDGEDQAWVATFLTDELILFDISGSKAEPLAEIALPSNLPRDSGVEETWPRPGAVVVTEKYVFVALSNLDDGFEAGGPGAVAVVDNETRSLSTTIELQGRDTTGLWLDEQAGLLYTVSAGDHSPDEGFNGNGLVELIDIRTLEIVDSVEIDGAPLEMVVSEDRIAYLVNAVEGTVLSFDLDTLEQYPPIDIRGNEDDGIGLSFASAVAVDGHGYLYAAEFNHDRLVVLDTNDGNRLIAELTVNDGPETLSFLR